MRGNDLSEQASAQGQRGGEAPIVIKKYANRRLYNTESSSYVTLNYLCELVKEGKDFVVKDAKTGEDITRAVLTQIIVEEESKGQNLLPIQFLRQLISFYGDSLENALPHYLEMSMERFSRDQERMRDYMMGPFGDSSAHNPFEDMARQNLALFEQAFNVFSPFSKDSANSPVKEQEKKSDAESKSGDSEIDKLRDQLHTIQKQLDSISKG